MRETVPGVAASRSHCGDLACLTTGSSARPPDVGPAAGIPTGAEGRMPRGSRAQYGRATVSLAGWWMWWGG